MKKALLILLLLPVMAMGQNNFKPDTVNVSDELSSLKKGLLLYQKKQMASQAVIILSVIYTSIGTRLKLSGEGGEGLITAGVFTGIIGVGLHVSSYMNLRKAAVYPAVTRNGVGVVYRFR